MNTSGPASRCTLLSLIEGGGNRTRCSYRPNCNRKRVRIEGECSCQLVFTEKRVLKEGGMYVRSFSIVKEQG